MKIVALSAAFFLSLTASLAFAAERQEPTVIDLELGYGVNGQIQRALKLFAAQVKLTNCSEPAYSTGKVDRATGAVEHIGRSTCENQAGEKVALVGKTTRFPDGEDSYVYVSAKPVK
jgi:hypothetical protein